MSVCLSAGSCTVEPAIEDEMTRRFESNFDEAENMMDLFPADLGGWTNVQCVQRDGIQSSTPSGLSVISGANSIALDTTRSFSAPKSLKFEAAPTGSVVSKASIAKQGVDFKPGDWVSVQFNLYLDENGSLENVFLLDLESMEVDGYPGRRLAVSSSEELILESKNADGIYGSGPNFKQTTPSKTAIPKGRWVSIELELVLSRDDGGSATIRQDGVLVLDARGRTFPIETDITHYDWVEFGLTANSSTAAQRLWIDDVSISAHP
jgi:hypothetical protein